MQYFLNLKKVYFQSYINKSFYDFNYLNIYYNFIKYNFKIKNYIFLKKYFIFKLNIKLLNKNFIFFNNNDYNIYINKCILNYNIKCNFNKLLY